ncbi:unnamed protein product [Ascophyllum nodosum]
MELMFTQASRRSRQAHVSSRPEGVEAFAGWGLHAG